MFSLDLSEHANEKVIFPQELKRASESIAITFGMYHIPLDFLWRGGENSDVTRFRSVSCFIRLVTHQSNFLSFYHLTVCFVSQLAAIGIRHISAN